MPASGKSRGSVILRPIPVIAVIVLVANDRWWKEAHPGNLTGKLSDIAGLALLSYVLVALADVVLPVAGKARPGSTLVTAVVACVIAGFVLVKVFTPVADAYGLAVGWLRHPFATPVKRVEVTHDVSDVIAAVGAAVAWVDLRLSPRKRGE